MIDCTMSIRKKDLSNVKSFTSAEKKWFGTMISEGKYTVKEIQNRYNLKSIANRKWLEKLARHAKKGEVVKSNPGRPPLLTSEQKIELKEFIKPGVHKRTFEEWSDKANTQASSNDKKQRTLSKRSLKRLVDELGVKVGNAEETTNSRYEAERSKRNLMSLVVGLGIFASAVNNGLLLNRDATQYEIGSREDKIKVIYAEKEKHKPLKVAPEDHKGNYGGGLSMFIKYDAIISGNGSVLEPVFIIQDDTLPKNQYRWYKVPGLTLGSDQNGIGHVVLSHSRCPPTNYHKEVNTKIIIPYIDKVREVYELEFDAPALLLQDGEITQNDCFDPRNGDTSVLDMFIDFCCAVQKLFAAGTAICQPADDSMFKISKAALRKVNDRDIEGHPLVARLEKIFVIHRNECIANGQEPKSVFSTRHGHMAARGLARIIVALQKSISPTVVMNSFRNVGMVPFDPIQMQSQFRGDLTAEDKEVFANQRIMRKLKSIMLEHGEISDEAYNNLGVFMDDKLHVDDFPIHRRRNVILTNPNFMKKRLNDEIAAQEAKERDAIAKEAKKAAAREAKERNAIVKEAKIAATAQKKAEKELLDQSIAKGTLNLAFLRSKIPKS